MCAPYFMLVHIRATFHAAWNEHLALRAYMRPLIASCGTTIEAAAVSPVSILEIQPTSNEVHGRGTPKIPPIR